MNRWTSTKQVVWLGMLLALAGCRIGAWGQVVESTVRVADTAVADTSRPEMRDFDPLSDGAYAPPARAYIPPGAFAMGNSYSNLFPNEGYAKELPVHEVPVSGFFVGRFEFTNEELARTLQWALTNGLVAVGSTVATNVAEGTTNVVTNLFGTVRNTEGTAYELVSLDSAFCQIAFTNDAFAVAEGKTNFPAIFVTWYGALAVCNYLSDREGLARAVDFAPADWTVDLAAEGYRLPTEAEWEKACRGGVPGTHFPWPDDSAQGTNLYAYSIDPAKANYLDGRYGSPANHPKHPWFGESIGTTPAGYYAGEQVITNCSTNIPFRGADFGQTNDMANGFGLYDMAGNVHEWCLDYLGTNWYEQPGASQPDPVGPAAGNSFFTQRVVRGGGWAPYLAYKYPEPSYQRCSVREASFPAIWSDWHIGFRVARRLTTYEAWAVAAGLDPLATNGVANADFDGDAFSNDDERIAGTQPTNAASFFRVAGVGTVSNRVPLAYGAVSGRVTTVETATNLVPEGWQLLAATTNAATGDAEFSAEAAGGRRFYRLRVREEP